VLDLWTKTFPESPPVFLIALVGRAQVKERRPYWQFVALLLLPGFRNNLLDFALGALAPRGEHRPLYCP
jgi:hypothetical protein